MYPFDFQPKRRGINHEEIFVVMPFANEHEPVLADLIVPACSKANKSLQPARQLKVYRTKDDIRTASGWQNVLEHLATAQIVLGVLTDDNPNVFYELGIAHATQQIARQILIAGRGYKPKFDIKDLIYFEYDNPITPADVEGLEKKIVTALEHYDISKENLILHARNSISLEGFAVVMTYAGTPNFIMRLASDFVEKYNKRHGEHAHVDHRAGMSNLLQNGLLRLNTKSGKKDGANIWIEFSFWWTDLGNDVLKLLQLIDQDEVDRRKGH